MWSHVLVSRERSILRALGLIRVAGDLAWADRKGSRRPAIHEMGGVFRRFTALALAL